MHTYAYFIELISTFKVFASINGAHFITNYFVIIITNYFVTMYHSHLYNTTLMIKYVHGKYDKEKDDCCNLTAFLIYSTRENIT